MVEDRGERPGWWDQRSLDGLDHLSKVLLLLYTDARYKMKGKGNKWWKDRYQGSTIGRGDIRRGDIWGRKKNCQAQRSGLWQRSLDELEHFRKVSDEEKRTLEREESDKERARGCEIWGLGWDLAASFGESKEAREGRLTGRRSVAREQDNLQAAAFSLVDRPTQLICISDTYLYLYLYGNRQIQKT